MKTLFSQVGKRVFVKSQNYLINYSNCSVVYSSFRNDVVQKASPKGNVINLLQNKIAFP